MKIMWSFITEKSTIHYKAETISYNYSLCVQWNLSWETYFIIGNHTHLCETTILCTRPLSLVRDHYFVYETIFCGVRPPSLVWAHLFLCETTIVIDHSFLVWDHLSSCDTTIYCATCSLMKLPQGISTIKSLTCFKRPSAFKDHNFLTESGWVFQ